MRNNNCEQWEQKLLDSMDGDVAPKTAQDLLQHAAECPSCGELMWLHLRLTTSQPNIPMPSEQRFAQMRQSVLGRVSQGPAQRQEETSITGPNLKSLASSLFLNPLFAYALLILMVFSVAIYSGSRGPLQPNSWLAQLESEIGRQARTSEGLQGSSDSPYILSNLMIRPQGSDRVSLEFDVTTHLEVSRSHTDPLVREALAQSLISASDVGAKLRAISFAGELPGPKVKEGLVFAALHDQNSGVRLSALSVLTQFEGDPLVQRACLELLRGDASVQMRLIAIDYLGRSPEILRESLNERWTEDPALRLRAATYLQ